MHGIRDIHVYVYVYIYIYVCVCIYSNHSTLTVQCRSRYTVKDKTIPLQAWTSPEVSRSLRLPDFKTVDSWRWLGCQPYAPAAFTPQEIFLVLIPVRGWVLGALYGPLFLHVLSVSMHHTVVNACKSVVNLKPLLPRTVVGTWTPWPFKF
jgi:hypothetical protein